MNETAPTNEEVCVEISFPFLVTSHVSKYYAFCKLCQADLSVEHGGKNDVSKHANCSKHTQTVEAQRGTANIGSFLLRGVSEADKVMKAEVQMAMLVAKSNISFSLCDDFSKSVADMFPDSAIAWKYASGRTKTTELVKGKICDFLF